MKEAFHPSIEKSERYEKGEARRILHELELAGEYMFHGSPTPDIPEIEPRQAHEVKSGQRTKHGEPAISATPFADIAIFRAVVSRGLTGFGELNGTLDFRATRGALDFAKQRTGYVYVLRKDEFNPFNGTMEYRTLQAQKPLQVIKVYFDDLPENINIIEPLPGTRF